MDISIRKKQSKVQKNCEKRAQVKGPICQAYILKEKSNFCFYITLRHIFNQGELGLVVIMMDVKAQLSQLCPYSTSLPSHAIGKYKDWWLTGNKWNFAHLHVCIDKLWWSATI